MTKQKSRYPAYIKGLRHIFYGFGVKVRIYGIEVSASLVSKVTDKIFPLVAEWQARPLGQGISYHLFGCYTF
jgi:hypothetical protein